MVRCWLNVELLITIYSMSLNVRGIVVLNTIAFQAGRGGLFGACSLDSRGIKFQKKVHVLSSVADG